MKNVIVSPTDNDLYLRGKELLGIDIHHSSFTVRYQKSSHCESEETLDVLEDVFPLRCLKKFFLINGKSKYVLNRRSDVCQWSPTYDITKSPLLGSGEVKFDKTEKPFIPFV